MSPEADLAFMEDACARIADAKAPGRSIKEKIGAIISALRTAEWEPTENRVYEWMKRRARRVDGFEKDRAREIIEQIEAENELRQTAAFERRLQGTLAHLKATDPDFYRSDIAALERVLLRAGRSSGAVGDR